MRITEHIMQCKVQLLNRTTGNPVKAGQMTDKGFVYHAGSYMVESSYNFYDLVQVVNSTGGQTVLTTGTKRDIVDFISAYLKGWSDAKHEGK